MCNETAESADDILALAHQDYGSLATSDKDAIKTFAFAWAVLDAAVAEAGIIVPGKTLGYKDAMEVGKRMHSKGEECQQLHTAHKFWQHRFLSGNCGNDDFDDLFRHHDGGKCEALEKLRASWDTEAAFISLYIIVYRLRSNLFQGEKARIGFTGQAENFRYATNVILRFLKVAKQ